MDNQSRVYTRLCWSKSRSNNNILCSACYHYCSSELFSTKYCCWSLTKHTTRQICDSCVHKYIVSVLDSCLVSSIVCPEFNCRAYLSQSIICDILLKYENTVLLNDYLREQQWQGKSAEWIERFTLRCPGCNVPIEKNGGCNQMFCTQCQLNFVWSRTNIYRTKKKIMKHLNAFNSTAIVDSIIFMFMLIVSVVFFLMSYNLI